MQTRTLVAFHRKLVDNGIASSEFDDVDQGLLTYLYRVLGELQDLKEIQRNLRKQVESLDDKVSCLRSHRKILRRVIVTAGLSDPFAEDPESSEFNAEEPTQVSPRLLETADLDSERGQADDTD